MLIEAYDSGWISSSGSFILEFQKQFADYIGMKEGVATSNGTSAIHLALSAAGIGEGDEVIVPDLTFVSPANMVLQAGARPVFVDSNKEYWGIEADTVREKLTTRTKAVIAVHLYGHPVDLDPLIELCRTKDLFLIEDCAEAHGALYKGKKVGSFGQLSCFSFYGNKLLTTGEGGMCLTKDGSFAEKMKMLRDHGADRKRHFWHPIVGFNYRMTNLQAAIGCAQLKSLDKRIEKYRQLGHRYSSDLKEKLKDEVVTHPEMNWATCVFWMYTLLIKDLNPERRERVQEQLEIRGIETRPIFYPISSLPPYHHDDSSLNSVASYLSDRGLSLPTYEELSSQDVDIITDSLVDIVAKLQES
jgi:perosamine synthetase